MRTPALLALAACGGCHVLFPRMYCPPGKEVDVSCAEAQAMVVDGSAEYVGYYHCSSGIGLRDGGCPDVEMQIE